MSYAEHLDGSLQGMSGITLQMNVGANVAGDWATRDTGNSGSATTRGLGDHLVTEASNDALMVRLHDLRGAVEAMRGEPHGSSIADTQTEGATLGYGTPIAYRGLRFVAPACS